MKSFAPKVLTGKEAAREKIAHLRKSGKTVGFVPTMGYLHAGHLQLVKKAKELTDIVVVSIYVNPAQFSQGEDFSRYPRDSRNDLKLLGKYQADIVFIPANDRMYDQEHLTWVKVSGLEDRLCGKSRPGHFQGVATIVLKLLNIIIPDLMFMGEKDYQQVVILERMLSDLDLPVHLVRCPTIREANGLAMSSRNSYLSPKTREDASSLYQSLLLAQQLYRQGERDSSRLISTMQEMIEAKGGEIDYISVIDSNTLEDLSSLTSGCRVVLAAFFAGTRLIDNIEIS
jgi:pantoate--beta-alanine ligase